MRAIKTANTVETLSSWRLHTVQRPVLSHCTLSLVTAPVFSANFERKFSMLRVTNRKECASIKDRNLLKYDCVCDNKLYGDNAYKRICVAFKYSCSCVCVCGIQTFHTIKMRFACSDVFVFRCHFIQDFGALRIRRN